jgi:hypothetical protein
LPLNPIFYTLKNKLFIYLYMNKSLTTYRKLCAEYYDLSKPQAPPEVLSFYMHYAQQAQGPLLEPMCGTGHFLIPLLQAGLDIEGFDASPYMLDVLKHKYAQMSNKPAPVWQQYIEDFKNNKQYQLIFVPFGSWGLLDLETSKQCLERMYSHLAPGGKFIIEIEAVASVPECDVWHTAVQQRSDGSSLALHTFCTYDISTQIFKALCRYELIVEGVVQATENEDFQMYLYQFNEIDALLKAVGFDLIKKYQDFNRTPASDSNAPLLIYECQK